MNDDALKWEVLSEEKLLHTAPFDVIGQRERSATGIEGEYASIDAPDWAMVIAEYEGCFVMARQWRHSARIMTAEFPGGVVDGSEEPAVAARRELLEETGFLAERMIHLGSVSPNPALFNNRFHVFLAEGLTPTAQQSLDDDELLSYSLVPVSEVIDSYGRGEYMHALMGAALFFYLRYSQKDGGDILKSRRR